MIFDQMEVTFVHVILVEVLLKGILYNKMIYEMIVLFNTTYPLLIC